MTPSLPYRSLLSVASVLTAAAAALIAVAVPAAAHAHVVSTSPGEDQLVESAATVHVVFDQPVDPVGEGLSVRDASGRRVDLGDVRHGDSPSELIVSLPADASRGAYLAVWQVQAGDSHVQEGGWTFVIAGAAANAPAPRPAPSTEPEPGPDPGSQPETTPVAASPAADEPTGAADHATPDVHRDEQLDLSGTPDRLLDATSTQPAESEPATSDPSAQQPDTELAAARTGLDGQLTGWQLLVAMLASLVAVAAVWPTVRASLADVEVAP